MSANLPIQYGRFLDGKTQLSGEFGFEPLWLPETMYGFQRALTDWSLRKGRSAIFADCGLGKTFMQLVWAENVVRKVARPVLVLTPLSVAKQAVREAEKFGVEAVRSSDGKVSPGARVVVTNYERLHHFNANDFAGVVADESSILKNFDGKTKAEVTEFMRKIRYRLLCTATAAPNDYIELGTSSEALGEMGFMDMLGRFFKQNEKVAFALTDRVQGSEGKWRFRGHAERDFWRWVCSWARAVRRPSDLGFDDAGFELPPLETREHVVGEGEFTRDDLFGTVATTLQEQREERRRTLGARCEQAAELVSNSTSAVTWCHLNDEGNRLETLINGAVQLDGGDPDERKEEVFDAFAAGQIRVLVTKPTIAGFGLNWQHCAHQTFFPSHSFEQYYQAIRRCWRFGQQQTVIADVVTSPGEAGVLANLRRKATAAEAMFRQLVELMNRELKVSTAEQFHQPEKLPSWL